MGAENINATPAHGEACNSVSSKSAKQIAKNAMKDIEGWAEKNPKMAGAAMMLGGIMGMRAFFD